MIKFKKDTATLLKISAERQKEGDMIGAISVLLTDKPYSIANNEMYYKIGQLYLQSKNYNLAVYNFLKYSQFASSRGKCKAYNAIGYAFLLEGKKFLADNFFNEQLEISYKQVCDYSEQMYDFFTKEHSEVKKFVPIKKSEEEISYHLGSLLMSQEKYEEAIEEFNKIKSGAFLGKSIFYKGMSYFLMNDTVKGLANMREYFMHFTPSVSDYLDFINLLSVNQMTEREYYIEELLKLKPKTAKESFYIAEMLFSYTEKYQTILEYLSDFNKDYPYSESAFCLKGLTYKYMGEKEKAFEEIKKAYLITHGAKYKYFLHHLDDKNYYNYPQTIKKEYQEKLVDLFSKPQQLTMLQAQEMVDYAIEFCDDTFWMMLISLLGDCKKNFTQYFLKELLIMPKAPLVSKVFAIEQLCLKGETGKLGIFEAEGFNVIELFDASVFKNPEFFKAYCKAYSRVAIFAKKEFINKAIKLESKLSLKGYEQIKHNDLVGLIICYGFNNSIKAPFYKSIYSSKAKINKLIKEYELF